MSKTRHEVCIRGDFDGGNPRSHECIEWTSDVDCTATPTWDDDPIRVYGMSFAVTIENQGSEDVHLTIHVDWGTTEHMDYKRVYYLHREGDDNWVAIHAEVNESVATVKLVAEPGIAYLSLSPMYNYSKYLAFVDALDQRAEAEVTLAGKSREDREIWRVQVPPKAATGSEPMVFLCRNNACETAGNYMIEGMVRFLFSATPEAAGLMDDFSFHFLPMTNPDGAFNGLERDTALEGGSNIAVLNCVADPAHDTIRKTLKKIKPTVFVNLHNWMMPEVDGLLCNEELYARRLNEILPRPKSPRRRHREWYSDEVTEIEDRGDITIYPISKLAVLHEQSGGTWKDFCREQLGARSMAVEFPWADRMAEDMRQLGIQLLKAVCQVRLEERGV